MNGPERPIKVLLLEDNPTDVALVTALLEAEALHCDLHRVTTGEDFAAALKKEPFDLIISDYTLPSFTGFAALALRQEVAPDVPFVLFSGSLGEEHAVESLKLGATDYVIKHRPERLGPSVRRAIQEAEVRAERRRIADKLRKQDELFRRIGESAEDLVAVLDVEGRRVYNSPSYRKLLGDPQSSVGTEGFDEIHPDDRERVRRIFRETVATGAGQRTEYRFLLNDGSVRFVESQGSVILDKEGRVENVVVISRDVTQRKQAEEGIAHRARLTTLSADVSLALTHGGPLREILRRCVEALVTYLDAAFARIWTLNKAENVLELEASAGMYTHLDGPHGRVPVGKFKIGLIAQERKPHLTNAVVGDPRVNDQEWAKREGMVAFAGYPLLLEERVVGVMAIFAKHRLSEATLAALGSVAYGIALGIERKRAEGALRESEERARLIIDTALDAVITMDAEGHIRSWNAQAEKTFGWSREEMMGKLLSETIIPLRYRVPHTVGLKQFLATGSGPVLNKRIEITALHRHGNEFPVELAIAPVQREGKWSFSAFVRDISGHKQAEERLTTQHAVTRTLAESASVPETSIKILQTICHNLQWDVGAFWIVDRTNNALRCIEIWHPPSTELNEFGNLSRQMTFARGVGLPGRVWASRQAEWILDVTKDSNFLRAEMASRLGLHTGFAFPIQLQGIILGVLEFFSAKARQPEDDSMAMFIALGSQIGQFIERKQVEEQFRQSQKMEAFGQLAGGVAHDFNNILAVIMGYTNLIMEGEELSAELKEQLKQVYSAGERAANLTRQLLTFSRKKEMRVSPLDLNEVIANITKMFDRIVGEDIKLQCDYASTLPPIQADEGMMEQVLMNLVVNARDAMPKGGQLIIDTDRVATDAGHVQSNSDARAGDFVCLRVKDTGCGMTPEIRARIFEPFFTTKGVGKGTGLGLATVFGIVKQHQGWIEVESQAGVGTTFKVFLPASARPDAAIELAATRSKVRGGSETILLVEDEVALRGLTKTILQRFGYRVLEAASGVEALSMWEQHGVQIDLLLTDMVMPDGLTGRELAKQLLARKPGLKVIYTSGYDMDSDGTTFRARDASTFLQKPYQSQKLAQAVRDCLDAPRNAVRQL